MWALLAAIAVTLMIGLGFLFVAAGFEEEQRKREQ